MRRSCSSRSGRQCLPPNWSKKIVSRKTLLPSPLKRWYAFSPGRCAVEERTAVKVVAAALGRDLNLRPTEAPVLRVVAVGKNFTLSTESSDGVMTVDPPQTALVVLMPSIEMPLFCVCPPLAMICAPFSVLKIPSSPPDADPPLSRTRDIERASAISLRVIAERLPEQTAPTSKHPVRTMADAESGCLSLRR